jgi:hypothetical protein
MGVGCAHVILHFYKAVGQVILKIISNLPKTTRPLKRKVSGNSLKDTVYVLQITGKLSWKQSVFITTSQTTFKKNPNAVQRSL